MAIDKAAKHHIKISFEVLGSKYYRMDKTYACEDIEDVVALEQKLLKFMEQLNQTGFKA